MKLTINNSEIFLISWYGEKLRKNNDAHFEHYVSRHIGFLPNGDYKLERSKNSEILITRPRFNRNSAIDMPRELSIASVQQQIWSRA